MTFEDPYFILRVGDYGHLLKISPSSVGEHPIFEEITQGPWDNIKELYIALMDKPTPPTFANGVS